MNGKKMPRPTPTKERRFQWTIIHFVVASVRKECLPSDHRDKRRGNLGEGEIERLIKGGSYEREREVIDWLGGAVESVELNSLSLKPEVLGENATVKCSS